MLITPWFQQMPSQQNTEALLLPPGSHKRRRSALEKELQREGLPDEQKRAILSELEKRESDYTRLQRQRMSADDFDNLSIIGRGAFGEVGCGAAAHALALALAVLQWGSGRTQGRSGISLCHSHCSSMHAFQVSSGAPDRIRTSAMPA